MAKTIQLTIQTAADLKGIQQVQKALTDLAKASNSKTSGASPTKGYADQAKAAQQAAIAAQKLATAQQQTAVSAQNLATAQARTASAAANAAAAQARAEKAALSLAQAQDRAAQASTRTNSGMAVLPRTIAGLSHEAAAFATASLSIGAAVGVATAAVNSFAEAFQFKAQLDATTLAINAQIQGVRDQGQVWSEASAFAQKFKLTQEETTNAISASIGVMRASKAPVEDILGVLARMQVLSPEQSLQEAAIALKALASGDTTSLVTRFEVGRDVANQMKAEIQGGADAVQVMGQFLGDIGIGMDVLASKTTGAAGAMKDLAIAQEELKFAQAEFAQGPGLAILEGQIRVTQGATRVLTGDIQAMGASLQDSLTAFIANAGAAQQYAGALLSGKSAAEANYIAVEAQANAIAFLTGVQRDGGGGTFEFAAATNELTGAMSAESAAAAELTAQLQAEGAVLAEEITKKQESELAAQKLAAVQKTLADLGTAVASGLQTAASAAAFLATRYNIASAEALRLVQAQAAIANVQAKVPMAGIVEDRLTRDTPADRAAVKSNQALEANRKLLANLAKQTSTASKARVSSAAAAGAKLEQLEMKTGNRVAEIDTATQQKLIEIDRKAAEERARIAAELTAKIAQASADRRASQEADDLDLIGVTDEDEAKRLNDREAVQAKAREREVAAAKEAQDMIANGEAEAAAKVYETRQKQIDDQQSLDEKYAERQRELAEDPAALDALKTQYDEATRAIEEQAATRIAIDKAAIAEKVAAVQAEKAEVIAAAEEQKNQVVSKAQQSAAGVMKASGDAKAKATADLKAIGDAVAAIPTQKTITITVNQSGSADTGKSSSGKEGTSPNKAAGGLTALTHGPTSIDVGDNPGGVELVTVTPISGVGKSKVGNNLLKLGGGGVVVVDAGDGYTTPVAGGGKKPGKKGKGGGGGGGTVDNEAARKAIKESIELIKLQNDLRKVQAEAARLRPAPINYAWIEGLAIESQEIAKIVTSKLLPLKKDEAEAFGKYASAVGQAADILKTIAELRTMQAEAKKERPGELVLPYITGLAQEAKQVTQLVRDHLIPETELEAEMYAAYADAVSSAVSVLNDVADLRKALKEPTPPIDIRVINQLVADAAVVSVITREQLVPTSEEQADALGLYADAVGSSVGILKDVSDLSRDMFADYYSPTDAEIRVLTDDAKRLAQGFIDGAKTLDTQTLEAAKLYTDTIGQVMSNVKDLLEVTDRIRFSDLTVDPRNLALLEESGRAILGTVSALGESAAAIPAGNVSALTSAMGAVKTTSDAMISLAAVPFADMPRVAGAFGAQGAGGLGGGLTVNIYNPPSDMNVSAVVQQVKTGLSQQTARRY